MKCVLCQMEFDPGKNHLCSFCVYSYLDTGEHYCKFCDEKTKRILEKPIRLTEKEIEELFEN